MMTFSEDEAFDREQLRRFDALNAELRASGITTGLRHAASSYTFFQHPDIVLDMVRPGMAIFGVYPEPAFRKANRMSLVPAGALRAAWLRKAGLRRERRLQPRVIAKTDTWVATLPVGHADGWPRVAAKGRGSASTAGSIRSSCVRSAYFCCDRSWSWVPCALAMSHLVGLGGRIVPRMSRCMVRRSGIAPGRASWHADWLARQHRWKPLRKRKVFPICGGTRGSKQNRLRLGHGLYVCNCFEGRNPTATAALVVTCGADRCWGSGRPTGLLFASLFASPRPFHADRVRRMVGAVPLSSICDDQTARWHAMAASASPPALLNIVWLEECDQPRGGQAEGLPVLALAFVDVLVVWALMCCQFVATREQN